MPSPDNDTEKSQIGGTVSSEKKDGLTYRQKQRQRQKERQRQAKEQAKKQEQVDGVKTQKHVDGSTENLGEKTSKSNRKNRSKPKEKQNGKQNLKQNLKQNDKNDDKKNAKQNDKPKTAENTKSDDPVELQRIKIQRKRQKQKEKRKLKQKQKKLENLDDKQRGAVNINTKPVHKITIRNLPPKLSQKLFIEQIMAVDSRYKELFTEFYYVSGYYPSNQFEPGISSRCYINCVSEEALMELGKAIKNMTFTDDVADGDGDTTASEETEIYNPIVEKSLYQEMPEFKNESGEPSIEKWEFFNNKLDDIAIYKRFCELIAKDSRMQLPANIFKDLENSEKKNKEEMKKKAEAEKAAVFAKKRAEKRTRRRERKKERKIKEKQDQAKTKVNTETQQTSDSGSSKHSTGSDKKRKKKKKNTKLKDGSTITSTST